MKLGDLQKQFSTALSGMYPNEEIQSFFSLLSEELLQFSRLDVALQVDYDISDDLAAKFHDAINRLERNEPIQYIIGSTEFYGSIFKVDHNVLIPRPETEELVSWIIDDIQKEYDRSEVLEILDIGTGSGCIAISLSKNLSNVAVGALDISEKALEIARHNANINHSDVAFYKKDILNCVSLNQSYDLIVSNPPYVTCPEKSRMKSNVLNYEPSHALFVPENDPLTFYRKIARLGRKYLKPGGHLYFEINEYLSSELLDLLKKEGYSKINLHKDIFGKDRMIKCNINE